MKSSNVHLHFVNDTVCVGTKVSAASLCPPPEDAVFLLSLRLRSQRHNLRALAPSGWGLAVEGGVGWGGGTEALLTPEAAAAAAPAGADGRKSHTADVCADS